MNGTEEHDNVGEMLRRAMPDDLPAAIEQCMQERVTAFRERFDATAAASGPLELARIWNRMTHWMGGLTMRQRIALGGVGMAATLAIVLFWGGLIATPVSAMEKMAENIRQAKSYTYNAAVHDKGGSLPPRPDLRATVYWIAPGSVRSEMTYPEWKGPGPEQVDIYPAGKPGIHIFHPGKSFWRIPVRQLEPLSSGSDDIERLGKFSGKADRQLGTKQINGKNAQGFVIDNQKMYPGAPLGTTEVWLDTQTNLPVLIRSETQLSAGRTTVQETTNIQWNIDLEPKLFDPTPPKGYTDTTPKPLSAEQQAGLITEALRIYAEASGGHYPAIGGPYPAIDDVRKMLGVVGPGRRNESGENAAKVSKVIKGMTEMSEIHVYKPEFAYYGKTVGPVDKDKVLVRWKLDDGRYEVIFGDLRSEALTAERLRALENK